MRKVIVAPAASGKSTMIKAGLPKNVVEADHVCHHTETLELAALRSYGKRTGNWDPYDREYGRILTDRTSDDSIILIPSSDLAEVNKFEVLAVCVLAFDEWARNVEARGESLKKYINNYRHERSQCTYEAQTNAELYEYIRMICSQQS